MSETSSVHGGGPERERDVVDDDDIPISAHEIPKLYNLRAWIIPPAQAIALQQASTPMQQAHCGSLPITCTYCNGLHIYNDCPHNPDFVNYVGHYQKESYQHQGGQRQQGWKQQPYRYQGQPQAIQAPTQHQSYGHQKPSHPLGLQQQHHQQGEDQNSLESLIKAFMTRTETIVQGQDAAIRSLEIQVGQLAAEIRGRPQGTLPCDTETPCTQGNEQVVALTLRSEKELEPPQAPRLSEKSLGIEQETNMYPQDKILVENSLEQQGKEPIQLAIIKENKNYPEAIVECMVLLNSQPAGLKEERRLEPMSLQDLVLRPAKASIEKLSMLELKALTKHLRYSFLGPNSTLHVITSSSLKDAEASQPLEFLKEHWLLKKPPEHAIVEESKDGRKAGLSKGIHDASEEHVSVKSKMKKRTKPSLLACFKPP